MFSPLWKKAMYPSKISSLSVHLAERNSPVKQLVRLNRDLRITLEYGHFDPTGW